MNQWFKISLMAVVSLMAISIFAAGPSASAAPSSSALSITPRLDFSIKSGESQKREVTIRNLDDTKPLELSVRVIDFTYTDQGGTPKFMLDPDAPQTTWSLRSYMSVPGKVTVEPGASRRITVNVSIPKEVGAGSYYSAIIYSAGADEFGEATNVGLSASMTTLAFVSVPGKVKEELNLLKFGAVSEATSEKPGDYKYLHWRSPKQIGYTLENKGNVVESPVGTILLKDLFGNEYRIDDINPSNSLALIGQKRIFKACIRKNSEDVNFQGAKAQRNSCATSQLWPGYYSATLAGFYGQNGNNTQEINGKASFWYLPTWFILASVVALAIIGYIIWSVTDRIRSRRSRSGRSKR